MVALVLVALAVTPQAARAQFPGFGWGGYGYPGMGYGWGGYGYPGMGYAYGYPGVNYAGPLIASPYANSLFGVGLSPLGVNSYFSEANLMGRAQLRANQRAAMMNRGR